MLLARGIAPVLSLESVWKEQVMSQKYLAASRQLALEPLMFSND